MSRPVLGFTQLRGQRMFWVRQPEREDDLSHAFSDENCGTKHCSERQVQLEAGAVLQYLHTPSWRGV